MPDETVVQDKPAALPGNAHLMCGWPLGLVAIGGAVGGGLGGAAYAINLAIYKSNLPVPAKVVLNLLSGFTAIILWLITAMAIQLSVGKPTTY